jgi:hypothetical protein
MIAKASELSEQAIQDQSANRLLKNTFLTHRDSGLNPVRIRYVSGLDPSFWTFSAAC